GGNRRGYPHLLHDDTQSGRGRRCCTARGSAQGEPPICRQACGPDPLGAQHRHASICTNPTWPDACRLTRGGYTSPLTVSSDQRIPSPFTLTGGGISWCRLQARCSSSVMTPCSEALFYRARLYSTLSQSASDAVGSCCRPTLFVTGQGSHDRDISWGVAPCCHACVFSQVCNRGGMAGVPLLHASARC